MITMRFKNFMWPNNPHTCTVTRQRQVASYQYPGAGLSLEDMGQKCRVLSGVGEFFGEAAYKNMEALLKVYERGGSGRLIHPVLKLEQAVFSELELTQEPRENFVAYRFVFLEEGNGDDEETVMNAVRSYVTQGGETLWDIASQYDRDVQSLMELNKWIWNPNVLIPGKKVLLQ